MLYGGRKKEGMEEVGREDSKVRKRLWALGGLEASQGEGVKSRQGAVNRAGSSRLPGEAGCLLQRKRSLALWSEVPTAAGQVFVPSFQGTKGIC